MPDNHKFPYNSLNITQETELTNTLEKSSTQDIEMRAVRTRVRKTPEKYRDNAAKTPNMQKV